MLRRLFSFAAAVSLLLCLGTFALICGLGRIYDLPSRDYQSWGIDIPRLVGETLSRPWTAFALILLLAMLPARWLVLWQKDHKHYF